MHFTGRQTRESTAEPHDGDITKKWVKREKEGKKIRTAAGILPPALIIRLHTDAPGRGLTALFGSLFYFLFFCSFYVCVFWKSRVDEKQYVGLG